MKCPYCKGTAQVEENVVDTYYRVKDEVQKRLKKGNKDLELNVSSNYGNGVLIYAWPWRCWYDGQALKFSVDNREVQEGPSDLAALAKAAYASWRKTGTIR